MKTTLLILMAVVLVGCSKKNPPKPAWDIETGEEVSKAEEDHLEAVDEWYNSLVVCLHCGSDLKAKGARVCSECLRPQR